MESPVKENSIVVEYSQTYSVMRNENGGFVYCNKSQMELYIFYSSFAACHVTETKYNGGAVYFASTYGKTAFKRIIASDCSAYEGHFIFITDANQANSQFELISTDKTYGNHRGCILLYYSFLEAQDYNSSFCRTNSHCNFHVLYSSSDTRSSHFNFYKCQSDILYGIDSLTDNKDGTISYANFVENTKSQSDIGLLYTLSTESYILHCSHASIKTLLQLYMDHEEQLKLIIYTTTTPILEVHMILSLRFQPLNL